MASVPVHCRHGQGADRVRYGTQHKGEQRYGCHHVDGPRHILLLSLRHQCRVPNVVPRSLAFRLPWNVGLILGPDDVARHAGLATRGLDSMV
jgi:hypothetical protein